MAQRYNSKLTTLALPSVIFEPKFRGAVRNLVYSDLPGQPPRRQELRHSRDLKVCGDRGKLHHCRNGMWREESRGAANVSGDHSVTSTVH
ncbi:unnamed protein product [Plutella xylostella]|uniref:(diamondback moth) hypothetical protein n=1 Tax=Plutella xylostella TaxID=51655 RepID=A0A8S4DUR4_PLUXY|nr:unnamed protein product [Plutella xylostella]